MTTWTLAGLLVAGLVLYLLFSGFVKTWRTYRGVRVITCPENTQPAAVRVAAVDAAKWFALSGETSLHLKSCSRWPEMAGCDEACLTQVQDAPEACRLQAIVSSWYDGKQCCFCKRDIGEIVWHERPPALRLADGTTREWKEVGAEELPLLFAGCEPVCFSCHVVETFRRERGRWVVERPRPAAPRPSLVPTTAIY